MSGDPALILTGAPGSGKTTVAGLLAATLDRAVQVETDRFFHFIASGYIEPWKPEAHEQNTTVMQIVGEVAARFQAAGYQVIVDGIVLPNWFLEPLRDSFHAKGLDVAYAVLRPPLALTIERAANRAPSRLSQPAVVERLWSEFSELGALERHAIDIQTEDPEAAAHLVATQLRAGKLTLEAAS